MCLPFSFFFVSVSYIVFDYVQMCIGDWVITIYNRSEHDNRFTAGMAVESIIAPSLFRMYQIGAFVKRINTL